MRDGAILRCREKPGQRIAPGFLAERRQRDDPLVKALQLVICKLEQPLEGGHQLAV